MNFKVQILAIVIIIFFTFSCKKNLSIKESAFSKSQIAGDYILDAPEGWWHWGMAPIYDTSGKLHVFMSAIPNDGIWSKDS